MHEGRKEIDEKDVRIHRRLGEAEEIHRQTVQPRRQTISMTCMREPAIQSMRLCRMMHGMKFPQKRKAMEAPMNPVLHQVSQKHDLDELNARPADCRPRPGIRPSRYA